MRAFNRSLKRKTYNLDGIWKMKKDPKNVGENENWCNDFSGVDTVVPSSWHTNLDFFNYDGVMWYYKKIQINSDMINITFNGVSGQSKVFLDGKPLGEHYGTFTKFEFVVSKISLGEHILCVKCDNYTNDEDTIPLTHSDWFQYGGIIRSVEISEIKNTFIKDIIVKYQLSDLNAKCSVEAEILKFNNENNKVKLYINNCEVQTSTLQNNGKIIFSDINVENINIWNLDSPNLYYFRLETEDDDLTERVGFRKVEARKGKIYLNDKEIYLKGINRHDEHPDWGFAVPAHLEKKDLDIIKKLGCNIVRGSHYPNSDVFLDLCDENGILFWEEIPLWEIHKDTANVAGYIDKTCTMMKEMVQNHYNHPSIIIWGLHNECDTDTNDFYNFSKKEKESINDNTRLITYASYKPMTDVCFGLCDIICVNKYIGLYEESLNDWDKFLNDFSKKLKDEKLSDKPVIISEFGAGGIAGTRTFENQRWTENFQSDYLDYTINLFVNRHDIQGDFVWQFADLRTARCFELNRPRSFNNKGILDEYRRPKQAFWTVQNQYKKIK